MRAVTLQWYFPWLSGESAEIEVREDARRHRYVIGVAGEDAGLSRFVDVAGQRVFVHTEIDPAHEGQGLASRLVQAALADVRAQDRRIVAICPYVRSWLERHHDFDDLLDPVSLEVRAALTTPA